MRRLRPHRQTSGKTIVAAAGHAATLKPDAAKSHLRHARPVLQTAKTNQGRAQENREDDCTPEKFGMECVEKPVAPLPSPLPAAENSSSLPLELAITARVRPSSFLELAKGIEPPTL